MDTISNSVEKPKLQYGTSPETEESWDMDEVLTELGTGRFQVNMFILIGILLMFSNTSPLSFTLTAADLNYRCYVPTCETEGDMTYKPDWLINAVPFDKDGNKPKECLRYRAKNETARSINNCSTSELFTTTEESCDRWIFATNMYTVGREFGIMCENRRWQLTLAGTANTIGHYIGISLSGFLSDRYGRKLITLIGVFSSTICGLLRALSTSYPMFLIFELLDALGGSGIYGPAFVLGLEFMAPKMRSIVSSTMAIFYPFGAVIMGAVAWWIQDWRKMLIICYSPGVLFISYYWLLPESARWLKINGRHEEATNLIKYISKKNRKPLSEKLLAKIKHNSNEDAEEGSISTWSALNTALKSRVLLFRTLACSYCWFTFTLVYYGLSINSVELVGEPYLNFILINLVEVPAFFFSGTIMIKYRRKPVQISTLFLGALSLIVCQLISADESYARISLFLLSKFLISLSFLIFYVYSAEMFPTKVRMSLFAVSSLIGRTGTILAPQTILLKDYFGVNAPIFLFSTTSLIAGVLSITFPETFEKKLPDTLKDVNKNV